MTPRAAYLTKNRDFSNKLLRLIIEARQDGLTDDTITAALALGADSDQQLAEHVIMLGDLLEGELAKLKTIKPEGSA